MKLYPPGTVTPYGAKLLLERIEPLIIYTSPDGSIQWAINGGLAPWPGVQEGAILVDGVKGLHPPFAFVEHKGARQHGVTVQNTVFDPAELDMMIEFTVPPNHADPYQAAKAIRRVIREWIASWDPDKQGTLTWITADMGRWTCKPRLFRTPPDKQFRAQARRLNQTYTWTIRNDDAFWRGVDSVSDYRFSYTLASDNFNRDDVGTLGPQWQQTYSAGAGICETQALYTTNEVQVITIFGAPTGGFFTVLYESNPPTSNIAYNASAATVRSALEALPTIGVGNVAVTGSAGGPWTVTFQNALGHKNVAAMTATSGGLTGGFLPFALALTSTEGFGYQLGRAAWVPSGTAERTVVNRFLGVNEVQTININGVFTGGTWTYTVNGQTTTGIAYNATPATVQTAIEALPNVAPGDVTVTGTTGFFYTVAFKGALSFQNIVTSASGASLTPGGTATAVNVGTAIEGTGSNTATDNQVITVAIGDAYEWPFPTAACLDIWARHNGNDASPTGIRARIGAAAVTLSRFNAGVETVMKTQPMLFPPAWWEEWTFICGTPTSPREYRVMRDKWVEFSHKEIGTGSVLGASNRGSGWGMRAGAEFLFGGQRVPPSVDEFSVGDNVTVTQSGHLNLTNFGDQDAYARYLCYGPGTFRISNGPDSTSMIEFGPLMDNQVALLTTLPRLRGVVDLSPDLPEQPLDIFQVFMKQLIDLATNNNVPPLLEYFESLFGILPPQGEMYALLKGRFTNPIPAKPAGTPPTTVSIAVEIVDGNADSKVVAALTPLRRWPE